MVKMPSCMGLPSSTLILAPGGSDGGASVHTISSARICIAPLGKSCEYSVELLTSKVTAKTQRRKDLNCKLRIMLLIKIYFVIKIQFPSFAGKTDYFI